MTTSTDPLYQKPNLEHLDVVLIKLTASEMSAQETDFKRIPVQAQDSISARWHPDVEKHAKEYRIIGAVPPGFLTEPEMLARQREYAGNVTDRANVGLTRNDHVPPLRSNDPTK